MNYKEITPQELNTSACQLIGKEWMLVTAGTTAKANTMTAAWGGLGEMWGHAVAFVVLRPQRYTKEFVDQGDRFSLTFYADEYKKKLSYLGTVSGRDEDKIKKSGLTLAFCDDTPYFEEANIVMVVKKLYQDVYKPECFIEPELIDKFYPDKDFHDLYICEIEKVLIKE
jgi:flavin reductase (DIM6/NTAB) family NADH-FMN oxidoreductase RutF